MVYHRLYSIKSFRSRAIGLRASRDRKLGNKREYSPIFKRAPVAKKNRKDNKDNSLHLGRKYARIFVLGHYLFLVAHSFPRASLSENCSLLGTDNIRGQISEHIFAPNGDYCLYIRPIPRGTCIFLVCTRTFKPNLKKNIFDPCAFACAWAYAYVRPILTAKKKKKKRIVVPARVVASLVETTLYKTTLLFRTRAFNFLGTTKFS